MKAIEIHEAAKINLPVVAKAASGTWYEITLNKAKIWFKKVYGYSLDVNTDASGRFFIFVNDGDPVWNDSTKLIKLKDHELISPEDYHSAFNSQQEKQELKAIVAATQAQSGEHVNGNYVLYKGKVYDKEEFPSKMNVVGQISTGAIYEIPPDAWWVLDKLGLKSQVSANRMVVFRNTADKVSQPWGVASITSGQLMNMQSQRKLDTITQVKFSKEISQALGLQQKVSVKTHIVPESKLHDVLRAVNDNPGIDRPTLYWRTLKLSKMPKYMGADDSVIELVKLGLVSETPKATGAYYVSGAETTFSITNAGKFVMAGLKAGKSIAKSSLIKQ